MKVPFLTDEHKQTMSHKTLSDSLIRWEDVTTHWKVTGDYAIVLYIVFHFWLQLE